METKCCSTCHLELEAVTRNFKPRPNGLLEGTCRACASKRRRAIYQQSAQKKRRVDLRNLVDSLKKDKPCADCGGVFPPICMDFDHLPGFEKSKGVARLVNMRVPDQRVIDEVAKCELVCANCHRIRTQNRNQWGRKDIKDYVLD